jgi:pentatricopeptide repeat protein
MSRRFDTRLTLAEHVRAACLEAALAAYEDAGIRGLCAEGRWEAALAAIRQLELSGVLDLLADFTHVDEGA